MAHAYSSLTFSAHVTQASFEISATVRLTASLSEYDAPMLGHAKVWAQIRRPDGVTDIVALSQGQGDQFVATYDLRLPGVFSIRVRARGETMRGTPFERERTLTAVATPGGDMWNPNDPKTSELCDLLHCLRMKGVITEQFARHLKGMGIDLPAVLKCLDERCRSTVRELD